MIRPATQVDIETITNLTVDGRLQTYRPHLESDYLENFDSHNTVERVGATIRNHLNRPGVVCLVYERDSRVVGYVLANTATCRIAYMFVDSQARGSGVGTSLMQALFSLSPDVVYKIEVLAKNTSAISLYERLGFTDDGLKDSLYFGLEKRCMHRPV